MSIITFAVSKGIESRRLLKSIENDGEPAAVNFLGVDFFKQFIRMA